ncbi:MAG: glutamate synthase, partial [Chlorobiaceae bacterium]|nr:glutamate synthase [Chlorobiaceae bacterium]
MAKWQCGLCSYIYDENKESVAWEALPNEWICPVCGSPKSSFAALKEQQPLAPAVESESSSTNIYTCNLCSYAYEEATEGILWPDLPQEWSCPVCGSGKENFRRAASDRPTVAAGIVAESGSGEEYLAEWRRPADDFETSMADIHSLAMTGKSIIEPMRSRIPSFSWDEILIKGAQLAKIPLNKTQPVVTRTLIGPAAAFPLILEIPVFVSHMSFGALSREAKLALAKGSAQAKTAMCSGEGGILSESLAASYRYIFEYVPNKYSVTDENLKLVDAVEIKIGQSAKPGMGGHLPGNKVTREIAAIRGFREGQDIISPSHFPD